MDGVEVFMSMSHREGDREWRREDRMWRKEDRIWRKLDHEWRQEDRKWRRNDRRYRQLEEARRKTDEWVEMINDIANVSALLAGFATAALVEAPLDQFWACYSETDDDKYFVGDASNCEANRLNEKYVISIWFLALFAVATSMSQSLSIDAFVRAAACVIFSLTVFYIIYVIQTLHSLWFGFCNEDGLYIHVLPILQLYH